jgi:hypothetical protein
MDSSNDVLTDYLGTVHFTSTDPAAILPVDATLTNGTGTFTVKLKTAGSQTITAADMSTASITGTSGAIAVRPAAAIYFSVSAPASVTAGVAFPFTVMALDKFNNHATAYAGKVHFKSTDKNANLPANSKLTNGTGTFSAKLKIIGSNTITAKDTVIASIKGTSGAIAVGKTGGKPSAGTWNGTADFGSFTFDVNDAGTGITAVSLDYSNYTCGGVTRSGGMSISYSSAVPITNNAFTLHGISNSNSSLTLTGKFTSSNTASGTFTTTMYGTTCLGNWTATK